MGLQPWYNPYHYGWGNAYYNGYNNGYWNGYANGYYDGYYNGYGNGYYYGPREATASNTGDRDYTSGVMVPTATTAPSSLKLPDVARVWTTQVITFLQHRTAD